MRRVSLQEKAFDQRVKNFSKGMRQKLGIAIAIVKDAPAVLLDEPTSGLDPKAAAEFLEIMTELRSEGKAVLMSTHDIFRAKEIGDRVGIMREGRLVMERTREELRHEDLNRIYIDYMESGASRRGLTDRTPPRRSDAMWKTIVKKELLETHLQLPLPAVRRSSASSSSLSGMYVNQADLRQAGPGLQRPECGWPNEAAAAINIQDLMAGTVAVKGFRRPAPLSVFTQGFESTLPRYYEFTQDGFKPGESAERRRIDPVGPGQGRFRLPRPDGHQPGRPALRLGHDLGRKGIGDPAGHAREPPAPGHHPRRQDRRRLPRAVGPLPPGLSPGDRCCSSCSARSRSSAATRRSES